MSFASAIFSIDIRSSTTTNCHALWLFDVGDISAARRMSFTSSASISSCVNFLCERRCCTKSLNCVITFSHFNIQPQSFYKKTVSPTKLAFFGGIFKDCLKNFTKQVKRKVLRHFLFLSLHTILLLTKIEHQLTCICTIVCV